MIKYVTGDLLQSDAQYLVNTVNCEGYMGKGLAYQFKLAYPNNNENYIKACKSGALRIGKLHYCKENGKIIINFPTKDKWRANSKIEYIETGLNELVLLIKKLSIKSIAIPPLGSGNGGLVWSEVKQLIEKKLSVIENNVEILIYEPAGNYIAKATVEPKLSLSALILMQIKINLNPFDKFRLQTTAYLVNIFSHQKYFNFIKYNRGIYDSVIESINKSIEDFQQFHNIESTTKAYEIAYRELISRSVDSRLQILIPIIKFASDYVNKIKNNSELECLIIIIYVIEQNSLLQEDSIILYFKDITNHIPEKDILVGIEYLYSTGIIDKLSNGYCISDKSFCD